MQTGPVDDPLDEQAVFVTDEQWRQLHALMHAHPRYEPLGCRARIILLMADGFSGARIASWLGVPRRSVWLCLQRFRRSGIEGLLERSDATSEPERLCG